MARRKKAMLNPHSYERISEGCFYVGSHLAGRITGSAITGYIWHSEHGKQGWDSEEKSAFRRLRKIHWFEVLRRCL